MRWVILVACALLLVACERSHPADPAVAIEALKAACNAACASATEATVTVPVGWSLAADPDGLCLAKGQRLLCATCGCGTYGLMPAQLVVVSDADRTVTCDFSGDAEARTLTATCA